MKIRFEHAYNLSLTHRLNHSAIFTRYQLLHVHNRSKMLFNTVFFKVFLSSHMNKQLSFREYEIIPTTLNRINLENFIFFGEISYDYYQLEIISCIQKKK